MAVCGSIIVAFLRLIIINSDNIHASLFWHYHWLLDLDKLKIINNKKVLGIMQKKTRSLLEELDAMYVDRDKRHIIENRASNVIASAIRLLEEIDATYTPDQADNLHRKLLNAIKLRDPGKFTRSVRRTDANS